MYVKYFEKYAYSKFPNFWSFKFNVTTNTLIFLNRAFICTLLKFDVQIFRYTVLQFLGEHTVEPQFKVPRYNRNLDIKEVFVSTEGWWTNFTA
jgi:hypothetical protein